MNKDTLSLIVILLLVGVVIVAIWFYMTGRDLKETKMNPDKITANGAIIETNKGNIEIDFFADEVPATVDNFVNLANAGFYDNTKFHRVIKDFMIQGGDPLTKENDRSVYGYGGPGYKFDDEKTDILLQKGIVAMANSGPNSNGSQFFIITATSTPWLQGKHTPFAKVVSGMDVVEKIENMSVDDRDIPVEDVVVTRVILK